LESDFSGLIFEEIGGRANDLNEIALEASIVLSRCDDLCERKFKIIRQRVEADPKFRLMCQEVWTLIFPVEEMLECTHRDASDLLVSTCMQILKLMAVCRLGNKKIICDVKTYCSEKKFLVPFSSEIHKPLGMKIVNGSECAIVFPGLTCDGIILTRAFVVASDDFERV
jgi:hypothetical protein